MNLDIVASKITPDIVLDVGACQGHFYTQSKQLWPDAHYHLFEANDECSEILEALNVDFTIACLSDKEKEVTFYTRRGSPCCTGASVYREQTDFYKDDNAVPHKVHTRTLDDVCSHLDFKEKKVLLKLDTQGSEQDIIKGGKIVLESCDAVIVELSLEEYNRGAPPETEVDHKLTSIGFKQHAILQNIVHPVNRRVIQRDALYLRE